jgi:hypothetical protein
LRISDFRQLVQGQLTLAAVPDGASGQPGALPGLVLLLDAREKSELLSATLEKIRTQLRQSNRSVRTDRLRNVEFTTLSAIPPGISNGQATAVSFGQAGSVLLVGTSTRVLERILARLDDPTLEALADQDSFQSEKGLFLEAQTFGWLRFRPVYDLALGLARTAGGETDEGSPMPDASTVAEACGLPTVKTLAFSARQAREGAYWDLLMRTSEGERKGVFNMLAIERKDASPAPFVPAEVVQFSRWRLDLKEGWSSLRAILDEVAPGALDGFVLGPLEQAAKERDPGFNFDDSIVGNLGNDVLTYAKAPKGTSIEALNTQPSLTLVGSPNPKRIIEAVRTVLLAAQAMLPPFAGSELEEREFQGRTIYSFPLPPVPGPDGSPGPARSFLFSAGTSYAAFTTDAAILEEFLRGGEAQRPLREVAGLAAAAQVVGGTSTGLFAYQNDAENFRVFLEFLKNNTELLTTIFNMTPLRGEIDGAALLNEWFDIALLPPFDQIGKYFGFTVYAGETRGDRYSLRFFTPTPPQMRE